MPGPLIAVVGVCAAGKSTLVRALQERGFNARQVLQEHSYVPNMWQKITAPDILIYLDSELQTIRKRRRDPEFPGWILDQERYRLRHARLHCDCYLPTDDLSPGQVLDAVLQTLRRLCDRFEQPF